jgi:hypothetical protein
MYSHTNGLAVFDGALTATRILSVEMTHLFMGIGSLIYLLRLNKA